MSDSFRKESQIGVLVPGAGRLSPVGRAEYRTGMDLISRRNRKLSEAVGREGGEEGRRVVHYLREMGTGICRLDLLGYTRTSSAEQN